MQLENFVAHMMAMNVNGRLWHWGTSSAQHHTTFENFLTQNEQFTDSLVESVLGNDIDFSVSKIGVTTNIEAGYDLAAARGQIASYRGQVLELQAELEKIDKHYQSELTSILDNVVELCSKTLYLLKLQ